MGNSLTAVIGADTSGFREEIDAARYMLNKYAKDAKSAKGSIEENARATSEQIEAYSRVVDVLEKVSNGSKSTTQEQKALAEQVQELKIQWANLSNEVKGGEFGKMLDSTLTSTQQHLGELTNQINQTSSNIIGSSGNVKRELKLATKELTNLTVQYEAMSQVERESAGGKDLAKKIEELKVKAGGLKDTISDVSAEISIMASDTPHLDAFNGVMSVGADLISTYASLVAKATGDEESFRDAINTVMLVQNGLNLSTKIAAALDSSSIVMVKLRALQEKAAATAINIRTAAENKGTIATGAATAAQRIFNAVAKANPYVLLATALLAVGTALFAFSAKTREAKEEQEKANKEAEKAKKLNEELARKQGELGEAVGQAKAKFYELQAQWSQLRTEAEKKKWIDDNQSAFKNLGISINSVKTAEDVFVKNTKSVIDALVQRAIAAKRAEQAADDLIKLDKKRSQKNIASGDFYTKANKVEDLSPEERKTYNKGVSNFWEKNGGLDSKKTSQAEKSGFEAVNKVREEAAQKRKKQLQSDYDEEEKIIIDNLQKQVKIQTEAEKKLSSLGDPPKSKHSSKTKKDEVKADPESLKGINDQISKLKGKLELEVNADSRKKLQEEIDKLEEKKHLIELSFIADPESLKLINEQISGLKRKLELEVDTESKRKLQEEIDKLEEKKHLIELSFDYDNSKIEELIKEINKPREVKAGDIYKTSDNKTNNKTISENNEKITANNEEIDRLTGLLAELNSEYEKLTEILDKGSELGLDLSPEREECDSLAKSIKNVGTELGKLNDDNTNLVSTNKKVEKSIKKEEKRLSDLSEATEAVSTMGNAFSNLGKAVGGTTGKMLEMMGTTMQSISQLIPEIRKIIVADQAESIANAETEASKAPWWLQIPQMLAVVATIGSIFAGLSSFAEGGIFGGSTTTGDYNIARVNKGEMILNGTQQKRLFSIINHGTNQTTSKNGTDEVKFVIKGRNLVGVSNNYSKRRSRI